MKLTTMQDCLVVLKTNSLTSKTVRSLKYVIKGIPIAFSVEEMKNSLTMQCVLVLLISDLKSLKCDKRLLPIFFLRSKINRKIEIISLKFVTLRNFACPLNSIKPRSINNAIDASVIIITVKIAHFHADVLNVELIMQYRIVKNRNYCSEVCNCDELYPASFGQCSAPILNTEKNINFHLQSHS